MEYYITDLQTDYLLNVNLEDSIQKYDDPQDICKWVFETYGDVFNHKILNERQVGFIFLRSLKSGISWENILNPKTINNIIFKF